MRLLLKFLLTLCFILLSPLLVYCKGMSSTHGPQNQFLIYKKPPPQRITLFFAKGGYIFILVVPPCFAIAHTLCRIRSYSWQLTYACTLQNTQTVSRFSLYPPCPFADPLSVRLPPARALCECASNVISTSSVSKYLFFSYGPYYSPILFCCQVIFLFLLFKVRYFYDIPVSTPQELRPDRAGARPAIASVIWRSISRFVSASTFRSVHICS